MTPRCRHAASRGASCQTEVLPWGSNNPVCDYNDFNLNSSNPNILYGGLVGGGVENNALNQTPIRQRVTKYP